MASATLVAHLLTSLHLLFPAPCGLAMVCYAARGEYATFTFPILCLDSAGRGLGPSVVAYARDAL